MAQHEFNWPPSSATISGTITVTGSVSIVAATGGTYVQGSVSTVISIVAPANTVGFHIQSLDTNTTNYRWTVGTGGPATSTNGSQWEPGRSEVFQNWNPGTISMCAESGTCTYMIQWILSS